MEKPRLTIGKDSKLPQFDMPMDFLVYDDIRKDLLSYYGAFPCKIYACVFCYITAGQVKASVNLWDHDIKAGDFVLVTPGSFIQIKEVSDDVRVSFMGFSSTFLKRLNFWKLISPLLVDLIKQPVFSMGDELGGIYRDYFALMTRASALPAAFQSEMIGHSAMNFLIESLHNAIQAKMVANVVTPHTREQAIVSEFLQLAFENYREEHKITFYAHEVGLTLSHFCSVVSKTTGMTPQELIMHMIIMDAKTQLKGTTLTVSRIASSLGFSTATTFNRYFRTYTGMTPLAYRNS